MVYESTQPPVQCIMGVFPCGYATCLWNIALGPT
jgi:hypothetical protein